MFILKGFAVVDAGTGGCYWAGFGAKGLKAGVGVTADGLPAGIVALIYGGDADAFKKGLGDAEAVIGFKNGLGAAFAAAVFIKKGLFAGTGAAIGDGAVD